MIYRITDQIYIKVPESYRQYVNSDIMTNPTLAVKITPTGIMYIQTFEDRIVFWKL